MDLDHPGVGVPDPGVDLESVRAKRRAIEWLVDNSLIDDRAAAPALPATQTPTCPESP
jgi:hypothetical protein